MSVSQGYSNDIESKAIDYEHKLEIADHAVKYKDYTDQRIGAIEQHECDNTPIIDADPVQASDFISYVNVIPIYTYCNKVIFLILMAKE